MSLAVLDSLKAFGKQMEWMPCRWVSANAETEGKLA